MMMLMGPHTALGNIPRSIEYNVDWVTGLLRHARETGLTRIEATTPGLTAWTDHVNSGSAPAYRARCDEVAAGGYRELALV